MKAKSIKGKSTGQIQLALQQSIVDGFSPTLALVFLSAMNEMEAIGTLLDKEGIAIFGATTGAEFTEEGTESEGIAILLLDMHPDHFRIILKDYGTGSVYETGCQVGEAGLNVFRNPAFIISAANYKIPGEQIIDGLVKKVGDKATIVGGRAGEMENFDGKVFTNKESSDNGLISLILDHDKISLEAMAVSGWKPVGTEKRFTRCDGSWIHTIDDQPAFDVIKKFLGLNIINDNNTEGVVRLNINYPLQIFREGGSPMMLPVLFANTEDGSIMTAGSVKEGTVFRFSMPPDFEVIDKVIKSSTDVKENEMPDADALIIFSCIGRLTSLGPMASIEVEGLADTWHSPMIGFYSLGEFGRVANGNPEFHGTTVSWVALKEK